MIKILNALTTLFCLMNAQPVLKQGAIFAMENVPTLNTTIDFNKVNVSYDLRLLFGDKDSDGKISSYEYLNYNFDDCLLTENEAFKFLAMKPNENDLYFYFSTNYLIDNQTLYATIDFSTNFDVDKNEYVNGTKIIALTNAGNKLNYYYYKNYYFYKFVLKDVRSDYSSIADGDVLRAKLYNFEFLNADGTKRLFAIDEKPELIYPKGTDWLDGNFYYFENNTYTYEAKLVMCLGVIEAEDYFPKIFGFSYGETAKETTVKSAQEITYLLVKFDDRLDLSELISVDVQFLKAEYEYVRYAPVSSTEQSFIWTYKEDKTDSYGDIYCGLYESDLGTLSQGVSANGKKTNLINYNEDVKVFSADGTTEIVNLNYDNYEALSDNSGVKKDEQSGSIVRHYYNPNLNALYNGFQNFKVLNNGEFYKKTIYSDYDKENYTYKQENNLSSAWGHYPYLREYTFEPIVNLNTYNQEYNSDDFKLSREFFDSCKEDYQFAIMIDGANSDEYCTRTVSDDGVIKVYSSHQSDSYNQYENLFKRVTTCHEIYGATILQATARQNNGEKITFNCLGDPTYLSYISFAGYAAPTLYDYLINDVSNFFNDLLNNPIVKAIMIILGLIVIAFVLGLLVKLIKFIIKLIKGK